jgi:hypothetical protein
MRGSRTSYVCDSLKNWAETSQCAEKRIGPELRLMRHARKTRGRVFMCHTSDEWMDGRADDWVYKVGRKLEGGTLTSVPT